MLVNTISIDERAAIVDGKTRLGDWEVDTVIDKGRRQVLVTLTKRKSMYTLIAYVKRRTVRAVRLTIVRLLGTAFFMFMAYRSKDLNTIAITSKHVVLADWCFTTPAIIAQVISGLFLMFTLGYSFSSAWFITVSCLYVFVGACWIPVVFSSTN